MHIAKSFCEVRYEPSFLFDDGRVRNEILKALRVDFPRYNYDENQKALIFISADAKSKVLIFRDRILIDTDDPSDLQKIKTISNIASTTVMKKLDTNTALRIGVVSQFYNRDYDGEEQTAQYLAKYLSTPLQLMLRENGRAPGSFPNANLSINVSHEFKLNLTISAHQEGQGQMGPDGQIHMFNVDKIHPSYNLDVYTTIPKGVDQINGVLKGAIDIMAAYKEKLWAMGVQ